MFTRLGACRRGTQRDAGVTTGRPYKVIDPFYGGPLDRLEEVTVRLEREPQVSVPELLRDVERVLARRDQQTRTLVPEVVPSDRARDAGRETPPARKFGSQYRRRESYTPSKRSFAMMRGKSSCRLTIPILRVNSASASMKYRPAIMLTPQPAQG